jgi:hypothetical protein
MPVIDPYGLFHGQRLGACSDLAQLYWPRLFCAANTFARLELHLPSIINQCFSTFQQPPSEAALWSVFQEYSTHYLALAYRANGRIWVQFMTEEKYLKKHKLLDDQRTPAPSDRDLSEYKNRYQDWKKRQAQTESPKTLSNLSEVFQTSFGSFSIEVGQGVGIGDGVGEGNTHVIASGDASVNVLSSSIHQTAKIPADDDSFVADYFVLLWNQNISSPLVKVETIGTKRTARLRSLVADGLTGTRFVQAIAKIKSSPFCMGEGPNKWRASFDWLITADNLNRVIEGQFDKPAKAQRQQVARQAPSYKDLAHHG